MGPARGGPPLGDDSAGAGGAGVCVADGTRVDRRREARGSADRHLARRMRLDAAAAGHEDTIAAGRIRLLRHEPPPWSSTALREMLSRGEDPPDEALHPAVARYIRKTGLYRPSTDETRS